MTAQALAQLARRVIEKQVAEFGHSKTTYVAVTAGEAEEHRKLDDETVSSFSDFISTLRVPERAVFIQEAGPGEPVEVRLIGPGGIAQCLTLSQPVVN